MAAEAWNVDLASGGLRGLRNLEFVADLTGRRGWGQVKKAYRIPVPQGYPPGTPDAWLCLPSPYSSVVKGPLANDKYHRYYWTNPGEGAFWSTFDDIFWGVLPYNLGFAYITPDYVMAAATWGGTATPVVRSYLFTLIDTFGQESNPCTPSPVMSGAPDGLWNIYGFPGMLGQGAVPTPPAGKNYPPYVKLRLYRTIAGASAGTTFYMVADFTLAEINANPSAFSPYVDTALDTQIVGGLTIDGIAGYAPPLDDMDGLISMPGGFMVGFTGHTLHFSEVNRPHAWPASYDLSVNYDIIGIALWNQTLAILTTGFPSTGSGVSPASFTLSQIQTTDPCISRGSIVTGMDGVYYASQNGLIQVSYYGMQNLTEPLIDRISWMLLFGANNMISCRHRSQYLALNQASHNAFIIDFTDTRAGISWCDALGLATCIWSDPYSGNTLVLIGPKVYRWDSSRMTTMPWRWRSKVYNLVQPVNLAAAQISLDAAGGTQCRFRLWAKGNLVYDQPVARDQTGQTVIRLPSGYKANEFQFELAGDVDVHKVKLATSMIELNAT